MLWLSGLVLLLRNMVSSMFNFKVTFRILLVRSWRSDNTYKVRSKLFDLSSDSGKEKKRCLGQLTGEKSQITLFFTAFVPMLTICKITQCLL